RVVVNRIAVGTAGRMRRRSAPAVGLGQAGVDGHKGTSTTDAGWRAGDRAALVEAGSEVSAAVSSPAAASCAQAYRQSRQRISLHNGQAPSTGSSAWMA